MDGAWHALRQRSDWLRVMATGVFKLLLAFTCLAWIATAATAGIPKSTEEALLKQFRIDAPDVLDCKLVQGLPFTAQELRLAIEGSPQVWLTSTSDFMCGQVNCSQWLYRRGPKKWELMLETQGYRLNMRAEVHQGYRDVETLSRDRATRVDVLA